MKLLPARILTTGNSFLPKHRSITHLQFINQRASELTKHLIEKG